MEKYLPHFTEEVLKRISAATYVATFADRMAFMETLQRHKEDFSLLLQHMADCYKALFADKSSVAITHPVNEFKSIHPLRKNITMLKATRYYVILEKGCTTARYRQLHTLISYVQYGNVYTIYTCFCNAMQHCKLIDLC